MEACLAGVERHHWRPSLDTSYVLRGTLWENEKNALSHVFKLLLALKVFGCFSESLSDSLCTNNRTDSPRSSYK